MASSIVNPAFEEQELNMVERGLKREESIKSTGSKYLKNSEGCLANARNSLDALFSKHRRTIKLFSLILLNVIVLVYLVFATLHWKNTYVDCKIEWCNGYGMLLILLALIYGGIFYYWVVKRYFGKCIVRCCQPCGTVINRIQKTKYGGSVGRTIIYLSIFAGIILFLIFDTVGSRDRLISAIGLAIFFFLGWLFSKHPANINWRPVLWGLILQFIFGLLTMRWTVGRNILQCVSNKVVIFLDFAKDGAAFIFSDKLVSNGIFAFAILPVIFYFSFAIQILYYLGVMQWVILKLGWILQSIMGTTLCESVNSAANIFIGMSESPLLIRPYINKLTSSELHAIMCSGFASVSGTVFAAYIGFGAQPIHLLTASVMAAPAALCYSKLFYPETEKSLTSFDNIKLEKSQDSGILDAATKGALAAIPLVLGIIANIVAFVSCIALINSFLSWLGFLVGYESLTFELILSKVFMPVSWIIGVPWEYCEDVATLIGLKTIVNEFIAYQKLGEFKRQGRIFGRTEAIATYAICGFANPGSIGIMLGMLTSLAPEKKEQITNVITRAFIAGTIVCLMTASIAGMLMNDEFFEMAANVTTPSSNVSTTIGKVVS